jgi:hypothetical protein
MAKERRSGRSIQSPTETVTFEILRSQAERIRATTDKEPAEVAHEYLVRLYSDARVTMEDLDRTSIRWLPEVYEAIVAHVGRGAVSHYIRESFYREMTYRGYKLAAVPILKEGHVEGATDRRSVDDGLADTSIVPLVIPAQWKVFAEQEIPGELGTAIKAATQKRLEKETGVEFPVQRRLGKWLGR